MKKFGILVLSLVLCGCNLEFKAGGYGFYEERNQWVENLNSYPIQYFDGSNRLVKTEYVSETSVKTNEAQTALVGYSVVSDKIYKVDYYEDFRLKANKPGIMNSASVPDLVDPRKPLKVLGVVFIDGVEYRLLPSSLENFVFMVKTDGSFFNEMGQIKNGRLVVLDAEFSPNPSDLRMLPVKNAKTDQGRPVKGFDIKYEGLKLGRIMFTYLDYSISYDGTSGEFENFSFPENQGLVDIYGIKIRVIHADEHKLDYILLDS